MGKRFGEVMARYGTVVVLLLLGAAFSVATIAEQSTEGADAAEELARRLTEQHPPQTRLAIVAGHGQVDAAFAEALEAKLRQAGWTITAKSVGHPSDARKALSQAGKLDLMAASRAASRWSLLDQPGAKVPGLGEPTVVAPMGHRWPNFLKGENLLNIANQIAVIAILAAGMTLVIVAGRIDLSVGSLIALSAVLCTLLIRRYAGAESASAGGMVLASLAAILACGAVGAFSGVLVARLGVPSFIVTLGTMQIASGLAYILSEGQSIYQLPDSFVWLGRGADLAGLPNAVVLMLLIYAAAHVLMTRTTLGRAVYAVGGNAEAARLAGVRVGAVVVFVFALSGALAGLGGVVMASQLKSGSPTYGAAYELYVIAAVVVGGTSLSGGEGRVLGTLVGALLIAVVQNGMNLTGVESYTQKVVLGAIIIGAVLIDRLKKQRLPGGS